MTIFHPTDFSEASSTAFEHALRLAFGFGTGLTIMHVGNARHHEDWSRFPHIRETLVRWNLVDPGMGPEELEPATGLRVAKIEATGSNPVDVLSHYLSDHDVSMVVMATHGRTGMAAMQHPSVARALARKIRKPFLFVREDMPGFVMPDGTMRLDRVLVPVDSEPDPQMAIDEVARLEHGLKTPVRVLEALHVGDRPLGFSLATPDLPQVVLNSISREGQPERVIPAVARESHADLIVMVYSGPETLSEKWLGSTTEQVVKAAPCPVLALPEPRYE